MFINLLKEYIISLALQIMLQVTCPASVKCSCLTGGFFFTLGKNMVDNHALRGHVIGNVTAREPVHCFRACRLNCQCISFNYQQDVNKDNCQLNEENRYTNFSALEFVEGWQYYDLVIDYNIGTNVPFVECQNGCCGNHPCLNGGTCHETCGVNGKRFTCDCGLQATGKLCETAICSTPDWLRFQNSCFKVFSEAKTWNDAQQSCTSINQNLTTIHSALENDFVRQAVETSLGSPSSVWIGLNNLNSVDGTYEWLDGSNVSFTNWDDGEPSNFDGSGNIENCTELRPFGRWNDLSCSMYHYFSYVCGKKWNP